MSSRSCSPAPWWTTAGWAIQLRNAGEDPHNLQIAREESPLAVLLGFPTLLPDENDRRFEDLAPGRYVLWCSLEGHEALGMSTTLDVR